MDVSVSAKKGLISYFDFAYFIKFIVLLVGLYYLNVFFLALIDERGRIHSAFFQHNLNYYDWTRRMLLQASNIIIHLFGLETYIEGVKKLVIPGHPALILGKPCVGLNMLIFWTAFVNAHNYTWKKNFLWTIGGIAAICLINCLRITLMAYAIAGKWDINRFMNHHDTFKLAAYSLIIVMLFLYNRYYTLDKNKMRA